MPELLAAHPEPWALAFAPECFDFAQRAFRPIFQKLSRHHPAPVVQVSGTRLAVAEQVLSYLRDVDAPWITKVAERQPVMWMAAPVTRNGPLVLFKVTTPFVVKLAVTGDPLNTWVSRVSRPATDAEVSQTLLRSRASGVAQLDDLGGFLPPEESWRLGTGASPGE